MVTSSVKHPYQEFLDWLKERDMGHIGRTSLGKKFKVSEGVANSVLKGRPLQERSRYLFWKATGLACFKPRRLSPVLRWMYDHHQTVRTLSGKTKIPEGTLSAYVHEGIEPNSENTAVLKKVMGEAADFRFLDSKTAPPRAKKAPRKAAVVQKRAPVEPPRADITEPSLLVRLFGEFLTLLALPARMDAFEKQLSLLVPSGPQVASSREERVCERFEALTQDLAYFLESTPEERAELIKCIGAKRYGYWLSLLSALRDEEQFRLWKQMTDHNLGKGGD